jgi:hypothetical protein
MKNLFIQAFMGLSLISGSLLFTQAKAQNLSVSSGNFEVGTNFGASAFLGDLGGNRGVGTYFIKDYNVPLTKLQKGLFVTYYPNEWIGAKFQLNHGMVDGDDLAAKDQGGAERYRRYRKLNFRSTIFEMNLGAEIYPLALTKNYDPEETRFRPYVYLGGGFVRFNPQTRVTDANGNSTWVDLKPLRTEGQGILPGKKEYSLISPNILSGLGFKYMLSDRYFVGLDVVHRFTFTDYIDDVSTDYIDPNVYFSTNMLTPSQAALAFQLNNRADNSVFGSSFSAPGAQRGNPKNNDSYFTYTIKFGIRLIRDARKSELRRLRCPGI